MPLAADLAAHKVVQNMDNIVRIEPAPFSTGALSVTLPVFGPPQVGRARHAVQRGEGVAVPIGEALSVAWHQIFAAVGLGDSRPLLQLKTVRFCTGHAILVLVYWAAWGRVLRAKSYM